jgi:transcriptional regulator with XRE-family HTH domain
MAEATPSLVFGESAKSQIGQRLKSYLSGQFRSGAKAAESLGISRQRLFSYTSGKSFPGHDVIDLIREKWGVDLLGAGPGIGGGDPEKIASVPKSQQLSFFDEPVTLASEQMTVTIERKGQGLEFRFEISAHAKIA